jgi:hypothetical protein
MQHGPRPRQKDKNGKVIEKNKGPRETAYTTLKKAQEDEL